MPTRNVVLTDRQEKFVGRMVKSGRYKNASEVLREGLRLVERLEAQDAAKLRVLRRELELAEQAMAAGDFTEYTEQTLALIDEEERLASPGTRRE